jgi:ParB/RepB/Spo0J family partition protein
LPFKTKEEKRAYMREYMRRARLELGGETTRIVVSSKRDGYELNLNLIDSPRELIREIDGAALVELRESIKANGVLQPILVRPKGERYEVVFGNHRFLAAKGAGLTKIPVQIRDVNDDEALLLAVTENVQRSEVNPIREGQLYERLMLRYDVNVLAEKIGKSVLYVQTRIKIAAKLHEELRGQVGKRLTIGNAAALCNLPKHEQMKVYEKLIENVGPKALYALHARGLIEASKGANYNKPKPYVNYCVCERCGAKHLHGVSIKDA